MKKGLRHLLSGTICLAMAFGLDTNVQAAKQATVAPVSQDTQTIEIPQWAQDNPYFEGRNSNGVDHQINKQMGDQFLLDFIELANKSSVGYVEVDFKLEYETFEKLNEYRISKGQAKLIWNDNVARLARLRTLAKIEKYPAKGHNLGSKYGDLADTMALYGLGADYNCENFASRGSMQEGYSATADQIVSMWENSSLHNVNLLDKSIVYGGIGAIQTTNAMGKGYNGSEVTFIGIY